MQSSKLTQSLIETMHSVAFSIVRFDTSIFFNLDDLTRFLWSRYAEFALCIASFGLVGSWSRCCLVSGLEFALQLLVLGQCDFGTSVDSFLCWICWWWWLCWTAEAQLPRCRVNVLVAPLDSAVQWWGVVIFEWWIGETKAFASNHFLMSQHVFIVIN